MSAPPGHRRGKRLLLAGVILTALGVVGFLSEVVLAALLVADREPGVRWIREG